jgi:hypothetical protein
MKIYTPTSHLLLISFLFFSGCQISNTDTKSPNRIGYIQPVKSSDIEDSYWGIQAGSLRDDILQRASELGVKWTRLQANWPSIEKEIGIYSWESTDEAFETALSYGITPFVTLNRGNELYTKPLIQKDQKWIDIYGTRPAPPTNDPASMEAWLNFVRATVERYKDRIKYWEIWNEPNHHGYWGVYPNANDYGRLLLESAQLIKSIDPVAKVIGGATAGMDPDFIDGYLQGGSWKFLDIISYHQYEGEPEERFIKMLEVRKVIDKYKPSLVTWQGECGRPSHSTTTGYHARAPWGLNIQAKWLLRQAFCDVYLCGSELSNYFVLYSGGDRNEIQKRDFFSIVDSTLGFYREGEARVRGVGVNEKCILHNPSNTPKPAYYAYQNLCAAINKEYIPVPIESDIEVIDQGVFYGLAYNDDAFPSVPIVGNFKKSNGSHAVVYWLPWHGQEYLPEMAIINLKIKNINYIDPVLLDLLSGEVSSTKAEKVDSSTLQFKNIPLGDYPILILEKSEISIGEKRERISEEDY